MKGEKVKFYAEARLVLHRRVEFWVTKEQQNAHNYDLESLAEDEFARQYGGDFEEIDITDMDYA